MKLFCYYCHYELQKGSCYNCPNFVKHFYHEDGSIRCVEIITYINNKKYVVDTYSKSHKTDKCFIITENYLNRFSFAENPGITPSNIKEKLKLILTFQ